MDGDHRSIARGKIPQKWDTREPYEVLLQSLPNGSMLISVGSRAPFWRGAEEPAALDPDPWTTRRGCMSHMSYDSTASHLSMHLHCIVCVCAVVDG